MDLKLSKYVEFVPVNSSANSQLVYALRTAKSCWLPLSVVNALTSSNFDVLSKDDIDFLRELRILVPADENELIAIIDANDTARNSMDVLSFAIQPTAQCQLGCGYCGQRHTRKKMSPLVREGIWQRVKMKLSGNNYRALHVNWFGAEPLLGMDSMRELTPRLRDLSSQYNCSYSASIVTNGLSLKLNVFKELLNLGVKKVEITLDGIASSHDMRRPTKSGEKTFDIIFSNLLKILDSPLYDKNCIKIVIRCNVDKDNYDEADALIDLLAENNLQNKVEVYFAPIHSWGNDAHLNALEHAKFAEEEINWLAKLYAKGFYDSCFVPRLPKKVVCMSLAKDNELVDAYGNVFNCTEFSYVPSYEEKDVVLGNIQFQALESFTDRRLFSDWNQDIKDGFFPCTTCKILPICGGACPKSWYEGNPACPSIKENLQQRLIIDALAMAKINGKRKKGKRSSVASL